MCQIDFVRVPYNGGNTWQRCYFLRYALSVASCNNDFAPGGFPADSPDRGPRILLGGGGNGAGGQDDMTGILPAARPLESHPPGLLLHCCAIGLGSAAAEILYVKTGHGTILAYVVSRSLSRSVCAACSVRGVHET